MKFSGVIGYAIISEVKPGVYDFIIDERHYTGDVLRSVKRYEASEQLHDNINMSNQISIVCDTYASEHLGDMRYVIYRNSKWKITSIEEKYPRLILTIGGVYNGEFDGTKPSETP